MSNEVLTQYKRYRARNRRFISAMVLLLAVTGIVSLIIGSHRIGWQELWAIVQNEGTEMNRQILLNIRLPRMLAAVITGIILSLSGAIMQILLRNPWPPPIRWGYPMQQPSEPRSGLYFWEPEPALPGLQTSL